MRDQSYGYDHVGIEEIWYPENKFILLALNKKNNDNTNIKERQTDKKTILNSCKLLF